VAKLLVECDEVLEVIRVDDDVLTAECCHAELLGSDTGEVHSLPDAGYVSLLGGLEGQLVLLQVDVGLSQLLVIADALVEDLSSQV